MTTTYGLYKYISRTLQILSDKYILSGIAISTIYGLIAIFAPYLAVYRPFQFTDAISQPPSASFPLGTDQLGGDILSQIIWGTRVTMIFAIGAAGMSLIIGVLLGSIAGYYGGIVDDLISRFIEIFLMIPRLFLIVLMVAFFGSNIKIVMLVVGLTIWPSNARIIRSQVLSLKERGFVQAAKVVGVGDFRILFKHILPNGIYPVIANSTVQMAYAIITEANLSFLGLGDPNVISWGKILYKSQDNMSAWWMLVFPGIVIMILVFAFHLLGDGFNKILSPKLQERVG